MTHVRQVSFIASLAVVGQLWACGGDDDPSTAAAGQGNNHASGGAMSGGAMSGGAMSGGAMSGGAMSGGAPTCNADFPCFDRTARCVDTNTIEATYTAGCAVVCGSRPCSGAICLGSGMPTPCPEGTTCRDDGTTARCVVARTDGEGGAGGAGAGGAGVGVGGGGVGVGGGGVGVGGDAGGGAGGSEPSGGSGQSSPEQGGEGGGHEPPWVPDPSVCGNSRVETGENCDDGNAIAGDGCSATCRVEAGWLCPLGEACVSAYGNPKCDENSCELNGTCSRPTSQLTCDCPPTQLPSCAPRVFLGLGFLPGTNDCSARGISGDGSIVVGQCRRVESLPNGERYAAEQHAVTWRLNAGVEALELDPSWVSMATAVDAGGSQIAGFEAPSPLAEISGFLLGPNGKIELGAGAWPLDMSADGSVIVGWLGDSSFLFKAGSGLLPLSGPAGESVYVTGVSPNGSTWLGALHDGVRFLPARGDAEGAVELLPFPAGATDGEVVFVSSDRSVSAGTVWFDQQDSQAVRWTPNGIERLVTDATWSSTTAATDDGRVLVGTEQFSTWIWDPTHGKRRLPDVLTAAGADLSDWGISGVAGVSNDGRVIFGDAQYLGAEHPNHEVRAFVAWVP